MQVGDLVKIKNNRPRMQLALPTGFGVITKAVITRTAKIYYVGWVCEGHPWNCAKPRPINAVYLEVINESR